MTKYSSEYKQKLENICTYQRYIVPRGDSYLQALQVYEYMRTETQNVLLIWPDKSLEDCGGSVLARISHLVTKANSDRQIMLEVNQIERTANAPKS